MAIVDLEQTIRSSKATAKVIKIKKKPSTFDDCTRFISNGFRSFTIEHDYEHGVVRSSVSTNRDSSLLASKTGVYRKYSSFDLRQIEAVH